MFLFCCTDFLFFGGEGNFRKGKNDDSFYLMCKAVCSILKILLKIINILDSR